MSYVEDKFISRYVKAVKKCKTDEAISKILDKLYTAGFEDGCQEEARFSDDANECAKKRVKGSVKNKIKEYLYTDRKNHELAYVHAVTDSFGRVSHFKYNPTTYDNLKEYTLELKKQLFYAQGVLTNYSGVMTAGEYNEKHRRTKNEKD